MNWFNSIRDTGYASILWTNLIKLKFRSGKFKVSSLVGFKPRIMLGNAIILSGICLDQPGYLGGFTLIS